jgi:thioredoxin-like negative regulator of GroEL
VGDGLLGTTLGETTPNADSAFPADGRFAVAESLAATMDSPRGQGDAALNLAEVMYLAGEPTRASGLVRQAIEHYEQKGAAAYVARAHHLAAAWTAGKSTGSTPTQARQGTASGLSQSA